MQQNRTRCQREIPIHPFTCSKAHQILFLKNHLIWHFRAMQAIRSARSRAGRVPSLPRGTPATGRRGTTTLSRSIAGGTGEGKKNSLECFFLAIETATFAATLSHYSSLGNRTFHVQRKEPNWGGVSDIILILDRFRGKICLALLILHF